MVDRGRHAGVCDVIVHLIHDLAGAYVHQDTFAFDYLRMV